MFSNGSDGDAITKKKALEMTPKTDKGNKITFFIFKNVRMALPDNFLFTK